MKDFAAIDFETANGYPHSVCSVGVVIVRNGLITESVYQLIHPTPNYYNPKFVQIHGLTRELTDPAQKFPEVWAHIAPKIEGLPLVAHNSRFDEGCLKAVFRHYNLPYPDYKFYCTYMKSRRAFGFRLPNHKLPTVAKACGFDLNNHHNAIADAEACAHIVLGIERIVGKPFEEI